MTSFTATSAADLLTMEVRHDQAGVSLKTTPPKDNGGDGSQFSPTDLLVTAYGTCMCTLIALTAKRLGLIVAATRFQLEKVMSSDLPRRVAAIRGWVELETSCGENDFILLVQAAKSCPVALSVHPDMKVEIEFMRKI